MSRSSIPDLSRTCSSWLDQHVSLVQLRPHFLNSLKVRKKIVVDKASDIFIVHGNAELCQRKLMIVFHFHY